MDFDFNQPVESIDKVPAEFRPLYAQGQDGKYAVSETAKPVITAITGLNTALKAAREEAKNKKAVDLTPLAEFGADPVAIKTAFDARVAELTAKGGDVAKAVEKVRAEMGEANKQALAAQQAKTDAYKGQLYSMLVKNDALSAIAEAKGLPDLLMPFIENQVRVVEESGAFVVRVVDAKGEPRYSNVTGQPLSIKELVAGMKADPKYGRLFESEQQSGGGGMPPAGGRQTPPQGGGNRQDMSANSKIAAGLKTSKYATRPAR